MTVTTREYSLKKPSEKQLYSSPENILKKVRGASLLLGNYLSQAETFSKSTWIKKKKKYIVFTVLQLISEQGQCSVVKPYTFCSSVICLRGSLWKTPSLQVNVQHKVKGCAAASKTAKLKEGKNICLFKRHQFTVKLVNAARQRKRSRLCFELQWRSKRKKEAGSFFVIFIKQVFPFIPSTARP